MSCSYKFLSALVAGCYNNITTDEQIILLPTAVENKLHSLEPKECYLLKALDHKVNLSRLFFRSKNFVRETKNISQLQEIKFRVGKFVRLANFTKIRE